MISENKISTNFKLSNPFSSFTSLFSNTFSNFSKLFSNPFSRFSNMFSGFFSTANEIKEYLSEKIGEVNKRVNELDKTLENNFEKFRSKITPKNILKGGSIKNNKKRRKAKNLRKKTKTRKAKKKSSKNLRKKTKKKKSKK